MPPKTAARHSPNEGRIRGGRAGVIPAGKCRSSEGRHGMGIGVSLLLIAAGAVLAFAVSVTGNGFNIHTIGIILLVVGAIGAVTSMVFWSSWGGIGGTSRRETIVEDRRV